MSKVLETIDAALAAYDARYGRPIAIELGERLYTQLILDMANAAVTSKQLTINAGRPLAYQGLESCAMSAT